MPKTEAEKEVERLTKELDKSTKANEALQKEFDEAVAAKAELGRQLTECQDKLGESQREAIELQAKYDEEVSASEVKSRDIDELATKYDQLKADTDETIADLNKSVEELSVQLTTSEDMPKGNGLTVKHEGKHYEVVSGSITSHGRLTKEALSKNKEAIAEVLGNEGQTVLKLIS